MSGHLSKTAGAAAFEPTLNPDEGPAQTGKQNCGRLRMRDVLSVRTSGQAFDAVSISVETAGATGGAHLGRRQT